MTQSPTNPWRFGEAIALKDSDGTVCMVLTKDKPEVKYIEVQMPDGSKRTMPVTRFRRILETL